MTFEHDTLVWFSKTVRPVLPDRAVGARARLRLLAVEQERSSTQAASAIIHDEDKPWRY